MTLGTTLKCLVRLCKTSDSSSPYIDLTDIQGPTIKMVENYGTTGSLSIVNEIASSSRNLLSSSCSRWSSGTGALTPGMFLHIWHTSRTDANKLGVFIITEISPSDDVISVTFGDCVQVLRATGADYYRNHYAESQQHTNEKAYGAWDSDAEKIYLTKPAGVTINAANGDVQWAVSTESSYDMLGGYGYITSSGYVETSFTVNADLILGFSIKPQSNLNGLNCRVRVYVNGTLRLSQSVTSTTSAQPFTFSTPVQGGTVRIRLDNAGNKMGEDSGEAYYSGAAVESNKSTLSPIITGATITYYDFYNSQEISHTTLTNSGTFVCAITTASYAYATAGEQDASDPTKYWITAIDGLATITSLQGDPDWVGRALITYLVTEGGMLMSEIFSSICDAAGVSSTVITSTRQVGIMRCGGADYFSYLLALADMEEPSGSYAGRQHAFRASRTAWGSIRMGYRYKASDSSVKTIYYAGDGSRSGEPFMTFVPTKTMQYRPYLAITRGTKDDGTPIILAMRDPDVSIGSASSLVDGSITEVTDAALSSYSEIATNRSKDWEGTVKLSGILLDLMVEGTYVGGAPVRIYDTRYGMSGYAARVKEVTLDFSEQTTLLTLNNYSEMYANSVIDSSKMAYSAGGLAVEASSSDLFTLQYVRLESSSSLSSSSSHTIEIYSSEAGWVSATAEVVEMTDFGIAVLSAYWRKGYGDITTRYGITQVRVDGSTVISIPAAKRPDKYSNQALIVNVQMSL